MIADTLDKLFSSASLPNSRETAELLAARYHSLDGVFGADPLVLAELAGERAAMLIKLTAATVCRRAEEYLAPGRRPSDEEIRSALVGFFCGVSVEQLYLISLDDSDRIIAVDLIGEGVINAANVASRLLTDTAVMRGAKKVIMAHNHPAGTASPSEIDIAFTDSAVLLFASMGARLIAHYVVAANQCKKID